MGKPYQLELDSLATTYAAAMRLDTGPLIRFLTSCRSFPLIAVGSGGSLTAAHFAAWLHERSFGVVARPATPLDAIEAVRNARNTAILLLSAGGSNPDIVGALRILAEAEPARLALVCGQPGSPLMKRAAGFAYIDSLAFELPCGRDGFLATNSLLTFVAVLARGYAATIGAPEPIPQTLAELLHPRQTPAQFVDALEDRCKPLWARTNLVVLHGNGTSSAAVDLESKFTEAALGAVQLADFRNFAHGRHHWLAKHGEQSAVLALVTEQDQELAAATLDLLPSSIPRALQLMPGSGVSASLAGVLTAFHIAGAAGKARGIDPGRPGVPAFGRKLYHLRTFHLGSPSLGSLSAIQALSIERKAGSRIEDLRERGQLEYWSKAYRRFVTRLHKTAFNAVVLDYDGTLCDTRERAAGLGPEIAAQLTRLARTGVVVGIVSGRGQSARRDLQRELPTDLWSRVLVGYYNGSDIAQLQDDSRPETGMSTDHIALIADRLQSDPAYARLCDIEARLSQISVTPKKGVPLSAVWDALCQVTCRDPAVTVVRSGHSCDILAPGISKALLVDRVTTGRQPAVLCIGDCGRWPGNDFALLSNPFALSVHEVSSAPSCCWNLAPPGQRGIAATLYYLRSLRVRTGESHASLRLADHNAKGES